MNKRIKELAEQAGFTQYDFWDQQKQFERFAELVAKDAVAKEREACLAIVETYPTVRAMSIAIRSRSDK